MSEGKEEKQGSGKLLILVSGDRDWKDLDCLRKVMNLVVANFLKDNGEKVKEVTLIHGGCRGADILFEKAFLEVLSQYRSHQLISQEEKENVIEYRIETYAAEWKVHGKRAGILRNVEMFGKRLHYQYHLIFLFHDDLIKKSKGTKHMHQLCTTSFSPSPVYFTHFLSHDTDSLIDTKLIKLHHPLSWIPPSSVN